MSSSIVIDLVSLALDSAAYNAAIEQVADRIRAGEIVVLPMESGYIFVCDAFNQASVARIHQMRGDAPGIAAQVLLSSAKVLPGIAQSVSDDMKALAERFWPGALTLITAPSSSLLWDLGDGGVLGELAMRVPAHIFTREVIERVGPLAASSAAPAGNPPALSLAALFTVAGEVGLYVDEGEIATAEPSTVVRASPNSLIATRVGAISLTQLREVIPTIQGANL